MIRYVRAWWQILKAASGTVMRGGRQVDLYFRYFVLRNLDEAGLFNYLEEPRTYGQILAHTGFSDNKFTRELLDVLAADRNNVIIAEDGHYRINLEVPLPTIDTIVGKTDKRFHSFTMLAEGMAANVVQSRRRVFDDHLRFFRTACLTVSFCEFIQRFDLNDPEHGRRARLAGTPRATRREARGAAANGSRIK